MIYKHAYMAGLMLLFLLIALQIRGQSVQVPGIAVPENKETIEVKVFPNPSDGHFRVELEFETLGKVSAGLYDMTGKLVKDLTEQLTIDDKTITADIKLPDVSSGIHFLRIGIGKATATKKIIIR